MKIIVKPKPNAKVEKVELIAHAQSDMDTSRSGLQVYKVSVKEKAVQGRANKAIIKALAKHFKIAPTLISLISGPRSKHKIFEWDK